jgi:TonB family protein
MCESDILVESENAICSLAGALGRILKVKSLWDVSFERNSVVGRSNSFRVVKVLRCAILSTFLLSWAACFSARAQDSDLVLTSVVEAQLDSLASRIAENIRKSNRDSAPAKVLVFDFTWEDPGISSRLGTILANRFSEMLAVHNNGVEVLDRKILNDYLKETWTRVEDLRSDSVKLQVAHELGATEVIRANLVEEGTHQLDVLVYLAGSEPPFSDQARFLITEEMEGQLSQPTPSYFTTPEPIPPEPGILVLGTNGIEGVGEPTCITCPDAKYTEAARVNKISGTLVLSAEITAAGDVTAIYVVKPLPLGLTQRAIDTIKNWKLKPAMKDGKPVAVRVPITMKYSLL